jgi:YD repeat-containing protein
VLMNNKSYPGIKYGQRPPKLTRIGVAISLLAIDILMANSAFGQCTPNAVTPLVTSQDGQEGSSADASPDENTVVDSDVPAGQTKPDPNGTAKSGDRGDGGGANGSPGGTDSAGAEPDASNVNTFSDISGFQTFSGNLSDVNVGGGTEQLFHHMADPIDVAAADKTHIQVDYLSLGANPIRMARSYHSNPAENPAVVTVPMGAGWHMFYDRTLQQISSSHIRLHRANGAIIDFNYNGSSWVSAVTAGVLAPVSGGWVYYNLRNTIETYNSGGRLIGLSDEGLVTQLQYDANGRLSLVQNAFGRALTFDTTLQIAYR